MPQLEDGYTRIAHELLEAITRHPFTKRQYKVLLYIIRKTYGYGKKTDDMTVTQIANGTGLTRPHASGALHELIETNTVLKRDGKYGYVLGINKDYGNWIPSQNGTCPKTGTTPSQNGTETVPKRDTQYITPIDNNQKKGEPAFLDKQTWFDFLSHRKAIKKPMSPQAITRMWNKLERMEAAGYDANKLLEVSMINGWQDVFEKDEAKKRNATNKPHHKEFPA